MLPRQAEADLIVRWQIGNTVSFNVPRVHDSGNSPEADAHGCLRPGADVRNPQDRNVNKPVRICLRRGPLAEGHRQL